MSEAIENVIIIWSGPAGHTAAIYAWRALLKPLMFEWFLAGGVAAGWQLTTTTEVENFPGFPTGIQWPELMDEMRKQSINSDTRIETKTVEKVDLSERPFKVRAQGEVIPRLAKSLIISTGAIAKRLWLTGEEKYRQRGVSACAVCDGALPIFRDKELVVIGWGDSACEEASFLTKFASKVHLLVRRDELRASKVMQERVINHEKIHIHWNTEGIEIIGDDKVMTWITIVNNQTQETSTIDAGWLFYAIGHKPNTDFLEWQVDLDDIWYIVTYNKLCENAVNGTKPLTPEQTKKFTDGKKRYATSTSVSGVFAAGDVQDKDYRQAITSAWTGCMAAMDAEKWLEANE